MDLTAFDACTFDCYGTLIDWETGILRVLAPLLASKGVRADDEELLRLYAEFERHAEGAEREAHIPYREVLAEVMGSFAPHFGLRFTESETRSLAQSVAGWPPFPDTPGALRVLKRFYKLAVVSNIDNDLFALTKPKLGIEWDGVITAELVKSYKPAPMHFRAAAALLERPPERILHVAESRVHDIVPAREMGFGTVWVNRRAGAGKGGGGASEGDAELRAYEAQPDLEVPDLATLVRLADSAWRGKR